MKKGTRTWMLSYMVIMHLLAIIGSTGIVMYMSLCYPGLWNWLILVFVSFFNYFVFDSMFTYIRRIQRRRKTKL